MPRSSKNSFRPCAALEGAQIVKHAQHHVFAPSDTVEMFVDGDGSTPHPMPKVDASNRGTVLSCDRHGHAHLGGSIHDPNSKPGVIHLVAGETILLTGPNALAAATADRIFVLAPSGGHLTVQRGSVVTQMVFHA